MENSNIILFCIGFLISVIALIIMLIKATKYNKIGFMISFMLIIGLACLGSGVWLTINPIKSSNSSIVNNLNTSKTTTRVTTETSTKDTKKTTTEATTNEADNYFNKGQELLNKLDSKGAIEYFNKAIAINSNNSEYYSAKFTAFSLADTKNYIEQIQCLDKAIELDSSNAIHYVSKAQVLSDLRKYDEALINSDKAITLDPKKEIAYMVKGKILATLNRFSDEIACYKDLAENIPQKQKYYELMEKTYRDSGKIQ